MKALPDLQAQLVSQVPQVYRAPQVLLEILGTGVPQGVLVSQGLMVCQDPQVPC